MLVLENILCHCNTIQLQLLQHYCWGIDLDYSDIEWLALEMNRNHSVIFETAPKYFISHAYVDYEVYSISSEEFLPTV